MCDLLLKDCRGFHKSPPVHPPYAEVEYVQKPLVKSDTCINRQSFFLNIKPPFPSLSHLPQIDLIHSFHSVFSSCLTQQQFRAYNLTALAGKPQDQTLHWRNIPHLWHVFWKKLSIRSLLWVVCFCARVHVCAKGCVQAVCVSLIMLGDFYFNKIWVTLPQSASSVVKMCSPVVGGDAFSSSLFLLWVFIRSSANSITGGWLTPQCPFLHRCRDTHTHTYIQTHAPWCLARRGLWGQCCVSLSVYLWNDLLFPSFITHSNAPFPCFLSADAPSCSIIHYFLVCISYF